MRKKIYYLLLVVMVFFIVVASVNVVNAEDYKVNTLIPVNTPASVETDKFDYKNLVYDTNVDAKGNATIKFEGIQNNTLSKTAISINVLLFDEQQKNIGFLTYCTDKDIESENAGFKIRANQIVPFSINVTSRYFVEGKAPKDVRYIAVRDENKYCQIGGYDNYNGLTIDEIVNGVVQEKKGINFPDISSFINVTVILVVFGVIAAIGTILGLVKLLKYLGTKTGSRKKVVNKAMPIGDATSVIDSDNSANKPIDLDSLYDNRDNSNNLNIPTQKQEESLTDLFNPTPNNNSNPVQELTNPEPSNPVNEFTNVNENTQAIPIDNIYNTISELPEIKEEETSSDNNSINDLYNSINGSSDEESSSSIDDLYNSINTDDEDDDLSGDE